MKTLLALALLTSSSLFAQDEVSGQETKVGNKKIVYTYKQYEKFDFDDLNIEGDTGAPSDISISPIHEKRFTNRLPYRKSFTMEIKKESSASAKGALTGFFGRSKGPVVQAFKHLT